MKTITNLLLGAVASVALVSAGFTGASAFDADANVVSMPLVSSDTAFAGNAMDASEDAALGELIAAVNQESRTFDQRLVSESVLESETGQAFKQAVLTQGASGVAADGSVQQPLASAEMRAAGGRIWTDAWGVHFTASSYVIEQLVIATASFGGSAAAVAAVLALNVEGFPISTGGAVAGGVLAASLFASAGILAMCNIGGNGAQLNYNWVTWTCWPL